MKLNSMLVIALSNRMDRKGNGFTLIDLLVVITTIGVLVFFGLGATFRFDHQKALDLTPSETRDVYRCR